MEERPGVLRQPMWRSLGRGSGAGTDIFVCKARSGLEVSRERLCLPSLMLLPERLSRPAWVRPAWVRLGVASALGRGGG